MSEGPQRPWMSGKFLGQVMTGQRFIRKWGKGIRGRGNSTCEGSEVRLHGVTGSKLSKGPLSTYCARC